MPEAGADAELVGVGGEELGGVGRAPARQYVDELEVCEGLNDREQHDDQGHRQEQRPCHVPKALPGPRPVDRRGLVQFGADGLQPGEQGDRIERHTAPDVDDDHRDQRQVRVA